MNELQAALFLGLLSIPFTVALGVKLTRLIFRLVLLLAAVPVLLHRAIHRAPSATYEAIDRCLQRMFPPRLEFRVEYATLEYYLRTRPRALTLDAHLRAIGGAS